MRAREEERKREGCVDTIAKEGQEMLSFHGQYDNSNVAFYAHNVSSVNVRFANK